MTIVDYKVGQCHISQYSSIRDQQGILLVAIETFFFFSNRVLVESDFDTKCWFQRTTNFVALTVEHLNEIKIEIFVKQTCFMPTQAVNCIFPIR